MMTNLLHGAHVANKLFSTIARLRLLLVMFVALSVSAEVWGATATLTLSSSKKFGTTSGSTLTDDQNNTWTCNGSNIQNTYNSTYKGQQFGTSKNAGNYTFACTIAGATISSVKITAAAGSTNAKYSISVGGSSKYSGNLSKTSTTYGGTNASGSGEISISLQGSGTGAAVYLGSITVVYTTASATKHTVTFNAGSNGTCSTPSLTEASAGAGVTLPNVTPNSDYRFLGWATTSAATTANAGKAGENYKPSSNITLYAIYVQQCTVQWYADGTLLEEKTYDKGSPIQAPTASVTPCEGMQHVGWTTTADYTHATELPSTFFQEDDPLGNATFNMQFYAVFAEVQESTATPTTLEETIKFTNFSGGTSTRTYESTSANWTWKKNDGSSIAEYDEIRLYAKHSMTIAPKTGCTISNIIATCTSGSYATALGGSSLDGATKTVSGSTVTITPTSGNIVITQKDQSRVSQFTVTFTTNVASGGKITNYTTTCTAKPTYSVTYNGNGNTSGSVPTGATEYAKDAQVTVLGNTGNLAKTGYTFSGWNTKDDGTGTPYTAGETFTITEETTLYAQWTANTHTITLDANGGSGNTTSVAATYDSSTLNPSSITNPTKTGHTFGGWYSGEGGTGSLVINTSGKLQANVSGYTGANGVWKATTNETLYAKWTPSVYTITYKDQGNATFSGTHESGNPTQHTYGTETTLKGATKTGYTFGGWYKEATCTNKVTSLGATEYTANITLYAQWTANTYTVKFDGNGSDGGSMTDQSFTYGQSQALSANAFTRTNYSFKHWTINQDGTGISYTDKQSVSNLTAENGATVTLYAQWTPTYTITWLANEQVHHTQTAVEGTTLQMPSTPADGSYSCDDKVFVGWTENQISGSTNTKPADLFTNKSGTLTVNKTYYAVFATAEGVASTDYTMITDINNLTDGNYVIAYGYNTTTPSIILKATTNDETTLVATSASPSSNKYQNPAAENIWTIKKNGTTYTLYNETTSKYVQANTTPALLLADANPTNFNIEYSSDHWKIKINGSTSYQLVGYTNVSGNYFQTKSSASGSYKIQLYKNTSTVSYSDYTTTCVKLPDPVWEGATIDKTALSVNCGERSPITGQNGAAKITFPTEKIYNFTKKITIEATTGFLVSTNQTVDANYKSSVSLSPLVGTTNANTFDDNVYVRAEAPAQSNTDLKGTITIKNSEGETLQTFVVTADVTCTQYTITWSVSGDTEIIEPTTFYAGGNWELPENPTFECNGREFVGWTNTEILQPQNIAPNVLYKEQSDFPTIESNTTFYAVFAEGGTDDGTGTATVTDILNRDLTGVTSQNTYSDWSGKTATSSAVYAGNSCGGNSSIQLRSDANKDAAGIITTTSGGKATNITVVWHNQTADGRTLNVYGKKSAYSAVADLRNEDTRGTLLGTIIKGTSTSLTINDDYEYIGLCSQSGAMYLTSISIQWETDGEGDGNATTYTSYTTSCADVKAIRIVEPTTETFNEGDKFVFDGKVWAINSDDSETDVTNSPYVRYDVDMYKVGTQTVTVSYLGFTATYEITINAVKKWQITWNVSGATNTGLSPVTVAKGTEIGKLPTPKDIPSGCTGKSFIGWTESNVVNADGSDITYLQPSDIPTKHTTYYAVFATPSGDDNVGDIFYESFNTITGTGGNDDKWNESIAQTKLESFSGWTLSSVYKGKECIKLGTGSLKGSASTPALGINGSATLTFNAGAWDGNNETLNIILNIVGEGHIEPSTFTLTKGQFNTYTANITGANANTKVQFIAENASNNRFFLDEVRVSEVSGNTTYTDYTTGCHDVTITYYGFTGGYTTNCGGSDLNVITQRVNSSHTIPYCTEITDPTTLGRTFLGTWKDQNGKERKPGDNFIVTENITFYAQWALNTSGNTTLPTDVEDLANTDIVVTGGNTLTLKAGTTTINSLTLKGGLQENGSYAMPVINIPTGATLVRNNNKINLDLKVNNNSYYPFAVPFEVENTAANVNYINPTLKEYANANKGYGKFYDIKEYNGALRAENGANKDENWVHVGRSNNEKLLPGKGYIISAVPASGTDTVTIRITMTVDNAWLANGEQESITVKEQTTTRNQVGVTAYTGPAATNDPCNAGWNFVANPYLTNFAGASMKDDNDQDLDYIEGEIIVNNGNFEHDGTKIPYVTIPASDFGWYDQYSVSDVKLSPMWSFFVQIGTDGTMNFTTEGRQQAPAALRASAAAANPHIEANLAIFRDEKKADHTGLIIDDRYTSNYEIGADLEKMFGSAYNTTIYTISQSTRLAYNALPHNIAQQSIPLGFRAAEEGEYTISLTNYEDIVGVESIILHDLYTGLKTNLLHLDYTFDSEATQDDNRFVVYIVARDNTTTDISTIVEDTLDKQNRKVLINNHLYIIHEGKMYNGVGQIVK